MKNKDIADLAEWIIKNPKDYCYEEHLIYSVRRIIKCINKVVKIRDDEWDLLIEKITEKLKS